MTMTIRVYENHSYDGEKKDWEWGDGSFAEKDWDEYIKIWNLASLKTFEEFENIKDFGNFFIKNKVEIGFYVKTTDKEETYTVQEFEQIEPHSKFENVIARERGSFEGYYDDNSIFSYLHNPNGHPRKYKVNKDYADVFQEVLNKYEKEGYRADAKQIALFMNEKIDRLILQSK